VATSFSLGLSRPNTVGGLVGAHNFQEGPVDLDDDEDEDEDDYEEIEDEEGEEGEEEETDLLGDTPEGPEKGFPPDDSESMDGLPTPDEEMLDGEDMEGGDEMDDVLAGIDPDLAGLGDDMAGPMGPDGAAMGPEMGDEMGAMGDEMGAMGQPDIAAADMPCPECNPDGEMEEGDPECEFCGGQGFVTDDQAEMPEDPDAVDAEIVDEDPDSEMMDLMARMQDYCNKYMPQYSRKFMDKDESKDEPKKGVCKGCGRPMPKCHCRKQCCKENSDFLSTLVSQAKGDVRRKYQSGLKKEDALLQPVESDPQPGQPGFAPQGRVGSIGGGYTQDDIADIPVLGESYSTWKQFLSKKK